MQRKSRYACRACTTCRFSQPPVRQFPVFEASGAFRQPAFEKVLGLAQQKHGAFPPRPSRTPKKGTKAVRHVTINGELTAKAGAWQDKMLDAAWEQGSLVMLHRLGPYERRHTGENREAFGALRPYVASRT